MAKLFNRDCSEPALLRMETKGEQKEVVLLVLARQASERRHRKTKEADGSCHCQERGSFRPESSGRLALSPWLSVSLSGKRLLTRWTCTGELAVLLLTGRMPCWSRARGSMQGGGKDGWFQTKYDEDLLAAMREVS